MASAYTQLIDGIIEQLEKGIIPWRMAYNYVAKSHSTGKAYSLYNQILLTRPGTYWTFKQIQDASLRLKKGSHASRCVFWKIMKVKERGESDATRDIPYLRYYNVFHESDIEGLSLPEESEGADYDKADAIIANYLMQNPEIDYQEGSVALVPPGYSPTRDMVHVHEKVQYKSVDDYYATIFHELIHSTGHKDRLDRFGANPADKTKEDYSREELVAEIGSAMLCGRCNIKSTAENAISYCAGWAKSIKDNRTWLNWAGKRAEEAIDFLLIGMEDDDDEME